MKTYGGLSKAPRTPSAAGETLLPEERSHNWMRMTSTDNPRAGGKRVAIVGAGSWGTALSIVAARNDHLVQLWAREEEVAETIRRTRKNPFYLSEFQIPDNVTPTTMATRFP